MSRSVQPFKNDYIQNWMTQKRDGEKGDVLRAVMVNFRKRCEVGRNGGGEFRVLPGAILSHVWYQTKRQWILSLTISSLSWSDEYFSSNIDFLCFIWVWWRGKKCKKAIRNSDILNNYNKNFILTLTNKNQKGTSYKCTMHTSTYAYWCK